LNALYSALNLKENSLNKPITEAAMIQRNFAVFTVGISFSDSIFCPIFDSKPRRFKPTASNKCQLLKGNIYEKRTICGIT
jgi:hypothetical protein